MEPWAAVLFFGFLPGAVLVFSVLMFEQLQIDDPVGAIPVMACPARRDGPGGLFHTESGLFYGGGVDLLMAQVVGVVGVFAFCMLGGLTMFKAIELIVGLRVAPEAERVGLDVAEHGNDAYPESALLKRGATAQREARTLKRGASRAGPGAAAPMGRSGPLVGLAENLGG